MREQLKPHTIQNALLSKSDHSSKLRTYIAGYALSILLTLVAYAMVTHQSMSDYWLVTSTITVLAMIQFIVQLVFFLHINTDKKQRWKLFVLCFMILVVAILVFGSVWIMNNLNARMNQTQIDNYMNNQDNL
jgi:cytochrome o ubiquinol oxidase operon protein cyoD